MWCNGSGYVRSIPISGGEVQWELQWVWSKVGSNGIYQAQDGFILP
jgi:hypothetical protein